MYELRIETDTMGEVEVPVRSLWGAQTQRSFDNFQISSRKLPYSFINALVEIKRACAIANCEFSIISKEIKDAIVQSADEILDNGKFIEQFPLDVFQTGSGTHTNMNVNEVLSNRAILLLNGIVGSKTPVHPNDHVNKGQSSNDVIPSAMHISALREITNKLIPAIDELSSALKSKEKEFKSIFKIGRTHLQDAVPLSLGHEFSGYFSQLNFVKKHINDTSFHLQYLAIGGTAVGTGLNAHPELGKRVCRILSDRLNHEFRHDGNKFALIGAKDAIVAISGALRTLAIVLMKIANDIRILASGPRCGLGEITLPANEPGSSIMPGKINPSQNEMLIQVAAQVIGNDAAISVGGQWGYLELNLMMPMMISNLLESIKILSNGMRSFTKLCVLGITANERRIKNLVDQSLMLVTALTSQIGYDKAAKVAKKAYKEGKTIGQVLVEENIFPENKIEEVLDVSKMVNI